MNRITESLSSIHLKHRIRAYNKHGIQVHGIRIRSKIHSILLDLIKKDRIKQKRELEIINDQRIENYKSTIYAVTHIGGCDIESAFEAIRTPAYLLLGDPKEIYHNAAGLLLWLNGVVCVETRIPLDRRISKETCINILEQGGNVLIFPEGAWNISPNQLVYYLFCGAAEMAIKTNSQIIPIGVIRNSNKYCVNIGKNIDCSSYTLKDKYHLTQVLRDHLATLQYQTMEKLPVLPRKGIDNNYYDKFVAEVIENQTATYSLKEVYETRFSPKNIVFSDDVFAHLLLIRPNSKTAFLLNKRLTGAPIMFG